MDERNLPELDEVCTFIQIMFDITYHQNWINQLVKQSKKFFIVDAIPLENEQFDLKIDDLKENHIQLSKLFENIDLRLLVNINKCGWGKMICHQ